MESWLSRIADYLLAQSGQVAVLTVVVAAAAFLLRGRSAHVRYLLWLLVLAKCLAPPVHRLPLPVLPPQRPAVAPMASTLLRGAPSETASAALRSGQPARSDVPRVETTPASAAQESLAPWNVRAWLGLGWLVGAAGLLFHYLLKALRMELWLRPRRRPPAGQWSGSLADLAATCGVKRLPAIWLVPGIGQPFVWGLLRGSVHLPAEFVRETDSQRVASLLGHELSHVLRCDAFVNILQVLAQVAFWFHPLVWWANAKIRAEREKCCDEATIARLHVLPEDYSSAIVETLAGRLESTRPMPSLAVAGPVKNLEERIRAMLTPGRKFYKRPSLIASIIVAVASLLTIPTALVLTARAQTEAPKLQPQTARAQTEAPKLQPQAPTPLCEAAGKGDIEQVRSLLAQGADVNARDYRLYTNGMTPLQCAAVNGHKNVVELLLAKGADVNAVSQEGYTAVLFAIIGGSPHGKEIVPLLLAKGARASALHMAAYLGDVDKAGALLDQGADVDAKWGFDATPLMFAALGGQARAAKLLIDRGADVNQGLPGGVAVRVAVAFGDSETVGLLIDKGADVQGAEKSGASVLAALVSGLQRTLELLAPGKDKAQAARLWWEGRRESVQLVLAKGGRIPALVAALGASLGLQDLVELAIDGGVDVNARPPSRQDKTLLHEAVESGRRELVQYLLDKGADVNAKEQRGWTPLHMAVDASAWNMVELLLAKGAAPNVEDLRGATALWYARRRGNEEMAGLLRRHGAQERAPMAPLVEAARDGDLELVKSLIFRGADVNALDGRLAARPLHLAAYFGHQPVVELLLSQGANVNALNKWNRTALDEAVDRNRSEIIEILRAHGAKPGSAVETGRTERAKPLLGNAPSKYAVPAKNLEIPEGVQACAANLRKICAALQKYERDKGTLPNWLSDLVPDYLSQEMLLCPHNPMTTGPVAAGRDPKLPCTYMYQFHLNRRGLKGPGPGVTTRDWKIAQVEVFGDLVPLVRCWTHGSLDSAVVNLDLNGRIYLSRMSWENMFMPDYYAQNEIETLKVLEKSSR